MRQQQTEVLVAGAGPVGMFTALLLAESGVKVEVIDKEARTAGHSYACALHPHTLKLLARAGVADEAIELGRRINTIAFYAGGMRSAELRLADLKAEFPFVLVLEQSQFEDLLEQKLRRQGVSVQWQHRLADLTMDEAGVSVTIEKLAATGKGYSVPDIGLGVDQRYETRAEYVVGADGQHSLVRDRSKVKYEQAGEREQFAVFEIESDSGFDDEMKVVFDRSTTSVMWPLAPGKCRWSFQMEATDAPGDFPDKDRSRLVLGATGHTEEVRQRAHRFLRDRAPWFGANIREVDWRTDIQFEHRLADHFGRGRCWLAGDAAHQTGPVGMQSMNEGLREAADLAEALRKILKEKQGAALLQRYAEEHRAEWRRLLKLDGGPKPLGSATNWVKGNCARILECLPASGAELSAMLSQLGLAMA